MHIANKKNHEDDALRRSWEQARRLRLPYMIMAKPDIDWTNTLATHGILYYTDGWLCINSYEVIDGERVCRPKGLRDIRTAIRMQDHILEGYVGDRRSETERLHTIGSVLHEVEAVVGDMKRYHRGFTPVLQRRLMGVLLDLEFCRDKFKERVLEQATALSDFRDSRGRVNQGVMRARTVSALENVSRRIRAIDNIVVRIALRRGLLMLEHERVEACLAAALGKITLCSRLEVFGKSHQVQVARAMNGPRGERTLSAFREYLGVAMYYLDNVYTGSHYDCAVVARRHIRAIKQAVPSVRDLVSHRARVAELLARTSSVLKDQLPLPFV
jgi:hypothetical protein